MAIQALRGTHDLLPGEVSLWSAVEQKARGLFTLFGFQEIRTPLLEEASLFFRAVGEASDIVQKEMYVFTDRGSRQICLRPEGTAGVARAYLEHGLGSQEPVVKLFYIGPMFRAERPQAGRQRQFHQIGVETIGSASPWTDVENLHLLHQFLSDLEIKEFRLRLNQLGCPKDRPAIVERLRNEIAPLCAQLCEDCRQRFDKNVLRLLDCKKKPCREKILPKIGNIFEEVCPDCKEQFAKVKEGLESAGIFYQVDPCLVRGLDYYTGVVFEVSAEKHASPSASPRGEPPAHQGGLGAQDTLAAGGRYDRLIEDLGGKSVPATGWALGIERLLAVLEKEKVCPQKEKEAVFIAVTSEALQAEGFKLLTQLREKEIAAVMDFENRSLKGQLRAANKKGSRVVVLLGEEEWKRGEVVLKDMKEGKQEVIPRQKILERMMRCHSERSEESRF